MEVSLFVRAFLVTLCLCALVGGTQVCYSPFGCFSSDGNDVRVPQDPLTIDTHFKLYTRKHRHTPYKEIGGKNWMSLVPDFAGHFDGSKPTKILIHGFMDRGSTAWISQIRDALLNKFTNMATEGSHWLTHFDISKTDAHNSRNLKGSKYSMASYKLPTIILLSTNEVSDVSPFGSLVKNGDFNVLVVDWNKGSRWPYEQATGNSFLVGAELNLLLQYLFGHSHVQPSDVHIVAHSLGAQVAGQAGKLLSGKIARISALDPADPGFTGKPIDRRLDASDAMFVDVIHTDGSHFNLVSGYGTTAALGDVDFYPNGGEHQPGCVEQVTGNALAGIFNGAFGSALGTLTCSHSRAHIYFLESITSSCKFLAHKCRSQADFDAGKCRDCPTDGCPAMGYEADLYKGTYFLATSSSSKFCGKEYFIDIHVSQPMKTTYGELFVTLLGSKSSSEELKFTKLMRQYHANDIERHVVATHTNIGSIKQVKVRFTRGHDLHALGAAHEISIKSVTVAPADDESLGVMFCAGGIHLQDNSTATLSPNGVC